jgi:hypothetical protein
MGAPYRVSERFSALFLSGDVMRSIMKIAAISAVTLAVAACGNPNPKDVNKADFSKAIQAYLDRKSGFCVDIPGSKHPAALRQNDPFKNRVEALVEAGLLGKRETEIESEWFKDRMEPATEYQATVLGKPYLVTTGEAWFCTELTRIDNYTEPGTMGNVTMSDVNFHYEITELAEWAQSAKLRAELGEYAFSDLEKNQDSALLILTNESWVHQYMRMGNP